MSRDFPTEAVAAVGKSGVVVIADAVGVAVVGIVCGRVEEGGALRAARMELGLGAASLGVRVVVLESG